MIKRLLIYAALALGVFSFTYGPGDSAPTPKKEIVKSTAPAGRTKNPS
jgi:hypothetical protein